MTKSLPKLPSMPKSRAANHCECGCRGITGNRFVPGHDAKLASWVKRVKVGVFNPEKADDVTAQLDAALDYLTTSQVIALADAVGSDWTEADYLARVEAEEAAEKTA